MRTPEVEELRVYNYSHHNVDNGINSSNVQTLMIDSDGKVWIGTDNGANAYDGHKFERFAPSILDSVTISGKVICDIAELNERYVCFAVSNGGLGLYDRYNCHFCTDNEVVQTLGKVENGDDMIYGVAQRDGEVYMALIDQIVALRTDTREIHQIPMPQRRQYSGMTHESIRFSQMPGQERRMAVRISKKKLGILDCDKLKMKVMTLQRHNVNYLCPIDSIHVYVGTDDGLYIYNLKLHKIMREKALGRMVVHAITKADHDKYWIAHDHNQLMCWSPRENKILNISNSTDFLNSQTIVNDIKCDNNGLIWLATNNNGLIKLDSKQPKVKTVDIQSTLPENYITFNLQVVSDEEVWASCGHDGVLCANPKTGTSRLITIPDHSVYSVFKRKNGDLYFDTWSGFERYDIRTGERTAISMTTGSVDSLSRIVVNNMIEDCLGNLWIGTQAGLFKYNGYSTKRMVNNGLQTENINVVYEDLDGRIWVGTRKGSYIKEPNDTTFVSTGAETVNRGAMNNTLCFADCGKDVLIGTTSGTLLYNKETRTVRSSNFNRFFGNSIVYSLLYDKNGVIWLSTNSGIGFFDTNTMQMHRYNHFDGLSFHETENRALHLHDDKIYFGRAASLNVIDINRTENNSMPPTTYVSRVVYGQSGEERNVKMVNDSTYVTKYLVKASLYIDLGSSDLSVPSRNEYFYSIDGGEQIRMGNNNQIMLSTLLPGKYMIEARSTNSDRVSSEDTLRFYVDIEPQLWLSKAAIVFYVVMFLAVAWLLFDLRFRNINRKLKQIEGEARAKRIVEAQRNKLARIHKDQTDSINYAKRIQDSIMPKDTSILSWFDKVFVFYKPKDIVSGDFYCFYNKGNKSYLVAGDCTGHGVPGAFISILGVDHLYDIIMKNEDQGAGAILTSLHRELNELIFKNTTSDEEFNEGMDITIAIVYRDEMKIDFAGAMNDLYMIRENELTTYRGNRSSIGTNTSLDGTTVIPEYTSHLIDCERGDIFYMFSDGYVDQFGGPEQKKFKHRRFKHLLLNIHELPAIDQKQILNQKHDEWKGKNDQTDDMLVMGFKPW